MIKILKLVILILREHCRSKTLDNVKDRTILVFHKEEESILEKKMDIDNDMQKFK